MLVVGGGLVGCAIAREAAGRGAAVTLLERAAPAREASWAAAGMLSPLGEAERVGPFLELALASLRLFPGFAANLEEESGIASELRHIDRLIVALDADDERALRKRESWQSAAGFPVAWLAADALRSREGAVAAGARGALALSGDALVNTRALGRAAWRAAERAGVRVRVGVGVSGLLVESRRVRGVRVRGGGSMAADVVVIAAGAWSGRLASLPRPLPIRPVRGQMLALATGTPLLSHMVSGPGAYLLPRAWEGEPRVWVGATMEEAGFVKRTTISARTLLQQAAARLVPALVDAPVREQWVGLRPATPDGLPVLGPDPEVAGLLYATGHFRNGILLAPVTARLIGRVLDGERPGELEPFRPGRFASDIHP